MALWIQKVNRLHQSLKSRLYRTFIKAHPNMTCLATLHTGIQCVLYPWGYRKAHKDLDDMDDIKYMDQTAKEMAKTIAEGTQRNFYYKQSYHDYPTYSN